MKKVNSKNLKYFGRFRHHSGLERTATEGMVHRRRDSDPSIWWTQDITTN